MPLSPRCLVIVVFSPDFGLIWLRAAHLSRLRRLSDAAGSSSWEALVNRDRGCVCRLQLGVEGSDCQQQLCWHTNNILDRWLAALPLTTARSALETGFFEHLKIPKWEINCIWDRWRANFAQYCDGRGYKWRRLLTAKWHMGGRRHMVLKLRVSRQYATSGMFAKAQSCVCAGIEEGSVIRVQLRFIYPAVWRKKKSCNRDESSMKGCFNQFPLPAESFGELTVKRLMFFKRPAIFFSPLNHKTLEEWLKLLLRPGLWAWILELSRYISNEIYPCSPASQMVLCGTAAGRIWLHFAAPDICCQGLPFHLCMHRSHGCCSFCPLAQLCTTTVVGNKTQSQNRGAALWQLVHILVVC